MGREQSAEAGQDAAALEDLVGFNLKFAYLRVEADFRATLGADGLSPRVFTALGFVVQSPGITQSTLARTIGIERSGLVAVVDDLEGRGYLLREDVPGDRRVHALMPTDAGVRAYRATMNAVRAHEDRLLSHLTDAERQSLLGILKKIRSYEGNIA